MVQAACVAVGAPLALKRAMLDASRKQRLIANFINSASVGMVMTSGETWEPKADSNGNFSRVARRKSWLLGVSGAGKLYCGH